MNTFFDSQLLEGAAILGEVAIGYAPMIDRDRRIVATRLSVHSLRDDGEIDASRLLAALIEGRIAGGPPVLLDADSPGLMQDLPVCEPDTNLMIEVPLAIAGDWRHARGLRAMHERGNTLMLKGSGRVELPAGLIDCFSHLIRGFDAAAEAQSEPRPRLPAGMRLVRSGVRSVADMEWCFQSGAHAIVGWPLNAPMHPPKRNKVRHELGVIIELIERVDAEEPIDRLEDTLRRDPTLAYHLLRHLNSAAFGLRTEISSFRQAIMMLGYTKLRRWLALLLITTGTNVSECPLKFAAVRRGLLMAELVSYSGDDHLASELFICGAFSLLDKMLGERFSELFRTVRVSADVRAALVDDTGPYLPFFDLVRAVESGRPEEIRCGAAALSIAVTEVNRATLRALANAAGL